jgi:Ca2+-binding EF-hand superfamily protein
MSIACPTLTDQQLTTFKSTFIHYAGSDGKTIPRSTFSNALRSIGIVPTREELNSMLQDIRGDSLDFIDFVILIYYFLRGADTTEEVIRAFAVFDEDKDGLISIETAKQVLINLKHPVPEDKVDQILRTLHRDDELIDYAKMIAELRPK